MGMQGRRSPCVCFRCRTWSCFRTWCSRCTFSNRAIATLLEASLAGDHLMAMARAAARLGRGLSAATSDRAHGVCGPRCVAFARGGRSAQYSPVGGAASTVCWRSFRRSTPTARPKCALVDDSYADVTPQERERVKRQLAAGFRAFLPQNPVVLEQFERLIGSNVPLGVLTDIMAFSLNLDLRAKQQLLEEPDADRRAAMLLERLPTATPAAPPPTGWRYPPQFSDN